MSALKRSAIVIGRVGGSLEILRSQRGGVAILIALSFLLLAVPLITGSLDLAQNASIDARTKTGITHRQYCALAVQEYMTYILADDTRWTDWWTANQDASGTTATEVLDPCGEQITITMTQQPSLPSESLEEPIGAPFGTIPPLSSYNNRNLRTSKTVSPATATPGQVVTYTITVTNMDANDTNLNQIDEELPRKFTYECDGVPDQLVVAGAAPLNILPTGGCPDDEEFSWSTPPGTSLGTGESATLTFDAVVPLDDCGGDGDDCSDDSSSDDGSSDDGDPSGTYCNEAYATPGGLKTRSGKTAIVQIGATVEPCEDEAVVVTKTVDTVNLVSTDSSANPFTYTFDVDYTITVVNTGDEDLDIAGIIDLLPAGFAFSSTSPSGDITAAPSQIHTVPQVSRERLTWNFNPDVSLNEGVTKTLIFSATATITQGNYWSDVLVDFAGGDFPEDVYTWPTALVSVKDVYDLQATDSEGNDVVIALQVWVGDEEGVISRWDLR